MRLCSEREKEELSDLKGSLIYTLCSSSTPGMRNKEEFIADMVFSGDIIEKQQLKLADLYIEKNQNEEINISNFRIFCGIGLPPISKEEINEYVKTFIIQNITKIADLGGKITHPAILIDLKDGMQRANPADLIKAATVEIHKDYVQNELLAHALTQDIDNKHIRETDYSRASSLEPEKLDKNFPGERSIFQRVSIEKLEARDLPEAINSKDLLERHLEQTKGKVVTRFPPEPNGILHIGHARAIRFNFSIAGVYDGICNLRYDDTNPEKEKKEFMDMIEENVKWMGFKPDKVVHTSHYFPKIYDYTVKLIKMGKAYVCHLTVEQQKEHREKCIPSPYRERSIGENLYEFERMLRGFYGEGEAVLRAKIDYMSPNTTLRDPSLYRITYKPHPVTDSEWCIYPLYDYSHALSDSIENITHSCCTLEFETRRDLYYWPLNQLGLYKPFVWEFSRLNVTFTLTSKRKIQRLIDDG